MVLATAVRGKTRGRIQIGADDPSLTASGGMLAAKSELCGKLGLIEALDEAMGPVKQRRRGFTGGQVLAGMAAAQLAGGGLPGGPGPAARRHALRSRADAGAGPGHLDRDRDRPPVHRAALAGRGGGAGGGRRRGWWACCLRSGRRKRPKGR